MVFLVYNFIQNRNRENHARQEVLPRLVKLAEDIPWTGEGPKPWAAYDLSRQIEQVIPDDPLLKSLYKKITSKVSINTVPSEVKVSIKPYSASSKNWEYIGTTPFDSIYLPIGISQIKFEKEGFQTGYDLIWVSSFVDDSITYKLIEIKNVTDGMVYIPNEASWFNIEAAPASLHMPGMEQIKLVPVDNFYMDRTEVSNKEYKEFVDAGGYTTPAYWKYPFMLNGKNLSWQKAMNLFVDKTKRYGPATWEVSDYPDGEDDLPVSGISWYEAAAFAEFKDKSLPTIYHWDRAAFTWASPVIVPQSNLGTNRPISVYDSTSLNRFGIYNLAGNVREWCFNGDSRNDNFILGGGWNDPAYGFNDAYAQSPFDRSETNGFRCIKYIDGSDDKNMLESKIELPYRDYLNEKPVSDERFSLILNQYAYDELPMNSKLEEEIEEGEWIRQKISFNAAYSGERMFGYLFMPKQYKPPYQTVIYFPGSGAIHTRSSKDLGLSARTEFLLKSGRALFIPIYKSTFERGDDLVSDYPTLTNFWKDHIIMWTKDFSRSIDYLETRDDIISDKLVYYGASWGGAMGGIIPAVEKRIKAVVLLVAGLQFQKAFTEAEAINFLPRITQPVLMLNGKYDFFFPYESAQIPFFKLLGTKEENKKIIIYEGGHTVPVTEQVKETLLWLDKYLGTVEKN
ncbi:MAG: SUMF1/EgtB/PvdO family nonheme iron enzyme [Ignavibacteriaceae bacterium]